MTGLRIRYSGVEADALATFTYPTDPPVGGITTPGTIKLALPPIRDRSGLDDEAVYGSAVGESWFGNASVQRSANGSARLVNDGRMLFAAWAVDEAASGGLEAATTQIYQDIARIVAGSGYPHIVKIWNYFPAINQGDGDDERYRRFCVARAGELAIGGVPPAATAIGFPVAVGEAPLTVLMLASKQAGQCIENPRQIPAFEYPAVYGPASPSFSRGIWMPWGQLFVSGTAAIVGHRSLHPGNVAAQVAELCLNLQALVGETEVRQRVSGLRPQALKIYLRHAEDAPICTRIVRAAFPAATPRLTVLGDICRRELLVEVEGVWGLD